MEYNPETETLTAPAPVDPTAEAERRAAVLRVLARVHPRLALADVEVAREGEAYRLAVDGIAWRASFAGPMVVMIGRVDPRASDVALEVARPVEIPLAPEPPASGVGIDVNGMRRRAASLLDGVRVPAERCRIAFRSVATTLADEVARLGTLVPEGAIDAAHRPLDHGPTLTQLTRGAAEAVAVVAELRAAVATVEVFLRESGPRIRAELVAVTAAKTGEASLASLGSLAGLGDVAAERQSTHEANLDDASERCDRLARALADVAPLVPRFDTAARRHVVAVLTITREVGVRTRTARLAMLRRAAEAERVESEAEVLAATLARDLGVGADVPTITWSRDPLEPPTLG